MCSHLKMTWEDSGSRSPRLILTSGSGKLAGKHWKLGDRGLKAVLWFPQPPSPSMAKAEQAGPSGSTFLAFALVLLSLQGSLPTRFSRAFL